VCHGLQALNERVKGAKRVLVVGGGALGVELAGEILTDHPTVKVTLVQSKDRLLPDMPPKASAAALAWLEKHGCEVNYRLEWFSGTYATPCARLVFPRHMPMPIKLQRMR
jgi:NADH dehydrogenase FAD-containing subunit